MPTQIKPKNTKPTSPKKAPQSLQSGEEVVLEIASFCAAPGVTEKQLHDAATDLDSVLSKMPGFIRRELCRKETNHFVDLVHWQGVQNAMNAMKLFYQLPEIAPFLALVDMETAEVKHYTIIDH